MDGMTVRFSGGQAITYNDANFVVWAKNTGEIGHALYTKKGGDLIAVVPISCIVEWELPCRVENPISGMTLVAAATVVLECARSANWSESALLCELKVMLEKFNRQRRTWRK